MAAYSGAEGCLDIMRHVANKETGFFLHRPTVEAIQNHTRLRLAPVTRPSKLFGDTVFMVRTILKLIDVRADFCKTNVHPAMKRLDGLTFVIPARYSRLIGYDKGQKSAIVAKLNGLARA